MEHFLMLNTTSARLPSDIYQQSPLTLGLGVLAAASLTFLVYLCHTPSIDPRAPENTTDKELFLGSFGFYSRKWTFFRGGRDRSKTGNFSFWLGKYHCVGVSGEAARKDILDNRHMDRVQGGVLHGVGPAFVPPIHPIFVPGFSKDHSYFQRRVLDFMKTDHLEKMLPRVYADTQAAFQGMITQHPSGVINPVAPLFRLVLQQTCRVVCTDEISDCPALMSQYLSWTLMLMHCASGHTVCRPWLPSISHMKRLYGRWGLTRIVRPIVHRRKQPGSPRHDDALQLLIDNGDPEDYIVTFFYSILFIAVANSGKLVSGLLNLLANHPDWQDVVYNEVKAAAGKYSSRKNATLAEQLGEIPVEAWEQEFPFLDLCFRELIRFHVSFPIIRRNMSGHSLPIPGSKEVYPAGSYAVYNTGDAHYNKNLYPNPWKIDPYRWAESGKGQHKTQSYSFLGWGNGRHRCVGQRWARIQQNIIIAYALATNEWVGCDVDGAPIPPVDREIDLETHGTSLPKDIYVAFSARK
ncbi:hypothetical protein MaudCBS49596_002760 [Microsporum audouinii]